MKRLACSVFVGITAACSPYSPDLGDRPFRCGDEEPRCPDGYACILAASGDEVCESQIDKSSADGGFPAFRCNSDSEIEPNETTDVAFQTGIAAIETSLNLPTLAICPSGDVDFFRVQITNGPTNLRAEIRFNSEIDELKLEVLDEDLNLVREGTSPQSEPDIRRADTPSLVNGTYFVRVSSPAFKRNNYRIELGID